MNTDKTCRICENRAQHRTFTAREMMFGFKDEFEYFECGACGSLQINMIPADLSKYYPKNYCSFLARPDVIADGRDNVLKRYLRHKRSEYALNGKSPIGHLANIIRPIGYLSAANLSWLKKSRALLTTKILDVGCGCGNILLNLERLGFKNLLGLDPYIETDIDYGPRVKILKKSMHDIGMKFDVIMLHHSLEHMSDPAGAFRDVARLLNDSGHAVIRTPIVPSYAWEHYGAFWVQLDAPRHLSIFSLKGIGILAKKEGLEIKDIVYDSTEFQFIGSEQYLKDIPMNHERSYFADQDKSVFKKSDIERFKTKAAELNRQKTGDQVAIYLAKP